jgi:hypothetical protein
VIPFVVNCKLLISPIILLFVVEVSPPGVDADAVTAVWVDNFLEIADIVGRLSPAF